MAAAKRGAVRPTHGGLEVVDGPTSDDHKLVVTDGQQIRTFLGGMVAFFTRATALEKRAKEQLDVAKLLDPPETQEDDLAVQREITTAKQLRKEVDAHWGITAVVFSLHKKLVAGRERAGKMLDEAAEIAQRHHNTYAQEARRKAQLEQDRINRENEERARQNRERELAELEAAALKAESESPELSERETIFVSHIIAERDAGSAAKAAGYKDPDARAVLLLKTPKIVAAIQAGRDAAALRRQAAAAREMPLNVETHTVRPAITRASGTFDRTTWSAEVTDHAALLAAAMDPVTRTRLGIPADIVTLDLVKLNAYARDLHELMNKWPGVRAKSKTSTV